MGVELLIPLLVIPAVTGLIFLLTKLWDNELAMILAAVAGPPTSVAVAWGVAPAGEGLAFIGLCVLAYLLPVGTVLLTRLLLGLPERRQRIREERADRVEQARARLPVVVANHFLDHGDLNISAKVLRDSTGVSKGIAQQACATPDTLAELLATGIAAQATDALCDGLGSTQLSRTRAALVQNLSEAFAAHARIYMRVNELPAAKAFIAGRGAATPGELFDNRLHLLENALRDLHERSMSRSIVPATLSSRMFGISCLASYHSYVHALIEGHIDHNELARGFADQLAVTVGHDVYGPKTPSQMMPWLQLSPELHCEFPDTRPVSASALAAGVASARRKTGGGRQRMRLLLAPLQSLGTLTGWLLEHLPGPVGRHAQFVAVATAATIFFALAGNDGYRHESELTAWLSSILNHSDSMHERPNTIARRRAGVDLRALADFHATVAARSATSKRFRRLDLDPTAPLDAGAVPHTSEQEPRDRAEVAGWRKRFRKLEMDDA